MSGERDARELARRRLMFVAGEDFYFMTYSMLVVLSQLGCRSESRGFDDSRKIAYLVEFLASDADIKLLGANGRLSSHGRARLALLHDRAVARRVPFERLVDATHARGIVGVDRHRSGSDRIWLTDDVAPTVAEHPLFEGERGRMKSLRTFLPRMRTMTLTTLARRLFGENEVRPWDE